MLNVIVFVSNEYRNSNHFSIQAEHIKAYAEGILGSIQLQDWDRNVIANYNAGVEVERVIASAVKNGKRSSVGRDGTTNFYWLADR